jgi:hypothetical protein
VAVTDWLIDKSALVRLAGLTVLHLDKDFEIIVGITGQPLERLNVS